MSFTDESEYTIVYCSSQNGKGMNREEFDKVFAGLTDRRREVLNKILAGETKKKIAASLHIAPSTVRKHIEEICDLFNIPKGSSKEHPPRFIQLISLFTDYNPELRPGKTIEVPQQQEPPVDIIKSGSFSPSEDIEALVQKVRSHFNKTIQYEYANLYTFNPRFNRRMELGKLSTMYVQTELNESDDYDSSGFSQERQSWKKVVLEKPQLMVLGKPGAGKTTLLH